MTPTGPETTPKHPNAAKFRVILLALSSLIAAGLAYAIFGNKEPAMSGFTVQVDAGVEDGKLWGKTKAYVVDPVVGLRPHRGLVTTHNMSALSPVETQKLTKRRCTAGFHRLDDLPAELKGPRVLFVGDSHLDGVVDTARNLTTLLEKELRAEGVDAWMLNAGCGGYSIWQQVLRAKALVPKYRPKVIVQVLFLGNDFVELEDRSRPYLTDDLQELPLDPNEKEPDIPGAKKELALGHLKDLYAQGFRQADWFHHKPERWPVVKQKIRYALDAMDQLAKEYDAKVFRVLIPPADIVFPEKLDGLKGRAREVQDSGRQQQIHDEFVAMLDERGAEYLDLLAPFRSYGQLDLYAVDFHIFFAGHRLIADRVLPVLRRELTDD